MQDSFFYAPKLEDTNNKQMVRAAAALLLSVAHASGTAAPLGTAASLGTAGPLALSLPLSLPPPTTTSGHRHEGVDLRANWDFQPDSVVENGTTIKDRVAGYQLRQYNDSHPVQIVTDDGCASEMAVRKLGPQRQRVVG